MMEFACWLIFIKIQKDCDKKDYNKEACNN